MQLKLIEMCFLYDAVDVCALPWYNKCWAETGLVFSSLFTIILPPRQTPPQQYTTIKPFYPLVWVKWLDFFCLPEIQVHVMAGRARALPLCHRTAF